MPQLDTIYTLTIFIWTWFSIHLISQKIKTLHMALGPKNKQPLKYNQPTQTLPWT